MARFMISMPDEMLKKLDQKAREEHRTRSELLREAARQVDTSLKRVEATRKALEFAQKRYEAEEKRMTVGLSTTFQLFQAQRDLASQKLAELQKNRQISLFVQTIHFISNGGRRKTYLVFFIQSIGADRLGGFAVFLDHGPQNFYLSFRQRR